MNNFDSSEKGLASERAAVYHTAIVESALDCVIIIDHLGRVLEFNYAAEQTFGYSREQVIGRPMAELIVPPSLRDAHYAGMQRYLETGIGPVLRKRIEITAMRSDGSEFPIELVITPIVLAGEPPVFTATLRDVTVRVRASDLEATISRAQGAFIVGAHPREFFNQMLKDLLRLTQSEYGFIGEVLHTPGGAPYLKAHAISNIAWDDATRAFYQEHAAEGMEFHNLSTLFGAVITTGKPVIANDPATDPRRGGLPQGHPPLHTFLGIPIKVGERMVGMVGVANRPKGYDESLIRFLNPFLSACSNLVLAWRAEKDRDLARQQLSETAARHQSTLESAVDPIIVIDERGTIDSVNPAAERTFGYAAAELVGSNVSVLMPAPFASQHDDYIARYLSTGEKRVIGIGREVPALRKDGSIFQADLAISEFEAGGKRFFTGILRDVTARKRAEVRQAVEVAAARCLAESVSFEAGIKGVLRAILASLDWRAGAYWQPRISAPELYCRDFVLMSEDQTAEFRRISLATSFPRGVGLPGRVWESAKPLWVADLGQDGNFPRAPFAIATGLRSGFAVPILRRGEVTGILEFFSDSIEQPDQDLLDTMAVLGHQIGEFIERNEAEERLRATLADLNKTREDLLAILNEMRLGTIMLDERGRIIFHSAACAALLRDATDSAQNRSWQELLLLPGQDADRLQHMLSLPEGERKRIATHVELPGGQHYWFEIEAHDDPRSESGRILFLYDMTEVHDLREEIEQRAAFENLVGRSSPMQQLFHAITELAKVDVTVLIEGETGSGKELVARALHSRSPRAQGPFLAVNCAGLSESLLSSQLFGHRRGAFTGAVSDQPGVFEAAIGGTVFLDEIGDITPEVQRALLRVLQEREITRLGEVKPRKVDVRIVAATHRDLRAMVEAGQFRMDLLYRIRIGLLTLPPLRERRTDIPLLVAAFLRKASATTGKRTERFSSDAMDMLMRYHWPGNVRQLQNAIEIGVVRCKGSVIECHDLPAELSEYRGLAGLPRALEAAVPQEDERSRFSAALRATRGNRAAAARTLGMSRATFYRRLKELGIDPDVPDGG